MNVLEKLKQSHTAIKTTDLGAGVVVGLRILTDQDYLDAEIQTNLAMRAAGLGELNMGTAEAFELEKTSQLLSRALVDVQTGDYLIGSPRQVRQLLSRVQRECLLADYLEHEKDYAPRAMTDDEFNALLDTLKKTPETVNLNDLNTASLKRLITALASPQTD